MQTKRERLRDYVDEQLKKWEAKRTAALNAAAASIATCQEFAPTAYALAEAERHIANAQQAHLALNVLSEVLLMDRALDSKTERHESHGNLP